MNTLKRINLNYQIQNTLKFKCVETPALAYIINCIIIIFYIYISSMHFPKRVFVELD